MFCYLPDETCFLADITTVSDRAAHKENPVDYFFQEVHKFLDKKSVPHSGIDIRINGDLIGEYRNQKVKLTLPPKGEIPKFIEKELLSFARAISSDKSQPQQVVIEKDAVQIQVSYTPNSKFSGGGYLSYTSLYSLTRNPIFNRLEEKADQLKKSGFSGITGIILCDGGCSALNKTFVNTGEISQDNIVQKFFQSNRRVSFVLVVTPEEQQSVLPAAMWRKYNKLKLFSNPNADFPITDEIVNTLNRMGQYLPEPESMPLNASRTLKECPSIGLSHYGAYEMAGETIKIPSRMLVELLAGTLDVNKFLADYKDSQIPIFFKQKILEGRMIEDLKLEKSNDDDDWVVIKFGEPDAAISPYR